MKRTLLKSFTNAFRGIYIAVKTERNVKIHVIGLCLALALGFYLGLTAVEWCLVIFSIGFVFTAELLNTALEKWCDEAAGGRQSEIIRNAKDISAAAVIIAAFSALIIGILVLIVPLVRRLVE